MKIVVYHSSYGCETGCCGHVIEDLDDESTKEFDFTHPYGDDPRAFAEEMVREQFGEEHVKDLDWENCEVSDC